MANRVFSATQLASFCFGTCAFERVAAVGLDLSKRGHVGRSGIWLRFAIVPVCFFFREETESTLSIVSVGADNATSCPLEVAEI